MKKSRLLDAVCACVFTFIPFSSDAALVERLGGLAYYDTSADLTWLADANHIQTSGYDPDGVISWTEAKTWAAGLDVAGVTGWRLPNTLEPDPSCDPRSGNDHFVNCTGSEMGNLFYNVLGNTAGYGNPSLNTGPFSNVQIGWYWSATECGQCSGMAWIFNMYSGDQNYFSGGVYAWAVHDGDIGAVPLPPRPLALRLRPAGAHRRDQEEIDLLITCVR